MKKPTTYEMIALEVGKRVPNEIGLEIDEGTFLELENGLVAWVVAKNISTSELERFTTGSLKLHVNLQYEVPFFILEYSDDLQFHMPILSLFDASSKVFDDIRIHIVEGNGRILKHSLMINLENEIQGAFGQAAAMSAKLNKRRPDKIMKKLNQIYASVDSRAILEKTINQQVDRQKTITAKQFYVSALRN